jgi:hypothetical protein
VRSANCDAWSCPGKQGNPISLTVITFAAPVVHFGSKATLNRSFCSSTKFSDGVERIWKIKIQRDIIQICWVDQATVASRCLIPLLQRALIAAFSSREISGVCANAMIDFVRLDNCERESPAARCRASIVTICTHPWSAGIPVSSILTKHVGSLSSSSLPETHVSV